MCGEYATAALSTNWTLFNNFISLKNKLKASATSLDQMTEVKVIHDCLDK